MTNREYLIKQISKWDDKRVAQAYCTRPCLRCPFYLEYSLRHCEMPMDERAFADWMSAQHEGVTE